MLDKDKVIEKMSERGFSVMSYSMKDSHIIEAIYFVSEPILRKNSSRIHTPSIGCNVHLEKEEFELMYAVPCSINVLRTPKCGSLMSDNHFDKLCSKFEEQAHILYRYFGRE